MDLWNRFAGTGTRQHAGVRGARVAAGLALILLSAGTGAATAPVGTAWARSRNAAKPQAAKAASGAGQVSAPAGTGGGAATGAQSDPTTAESLRSVSPAGASTASKEDLGAARRANATPSLQQQIAKLPPLTGVNVDVAKRGQEILGHLNAVLHFYQSAVAPVQKVGQPSDVLYAEESTSQATQIAQLAFQAARNEAALLSKIVGKPGMKTAPGVASSPEAGAQQASEAQRLSALLAQTAQRVSDLQTEDASLAQQLATARGKAIPALEQQRGQVQGELELQKAMSEALGRVESFSTAQTHTGLAGEIDRLQQSAPELLNAAKKPTPATMENLTTAHDTGVTSQAVVLFQLLSTLHTIDNAVDATEHLRAQAQDLRTPLLKILRSTVAKGQALAQTPTPSPAPTPAPVPAPTRTGKKGRAAAAASAASTVGAPVIDAQTLASVRKQFDQLTATFQVLSSATMPLSQEIVLLASERETLATWRSAVNVEYRSVLRQLLLRVVAIAVALGILALISSLWGRATVRYVSDLRRRRQLLFVRRAVIGFLSGLVILFGFVTQFSSLATFAGFISAGIAVGLQTILLSVAAYFFIIGRYGVRVGDRITVAGVTGDVIEVGLARFYMIELVGAGNAMHSTGRVAVFANSVLFQTGTPIYKQMPGTEYAWHQLTAKLNGEADTQATAEAVLAAVRKVYGTYRARIEAQHQQVEAWMGAALPAPNLESWLELADGGLQFAVLFPVEIGNAATTDQQIAEELVSEMRSNGAMKAGMTALPIIKAAVKS